MGAIFAVHPSQISPICSLPPSLSPNLRSVPFPLSNRPIRNHRRSSAVFAESNGKGNGTGDGGDDLKRDRQPPAFKINWRDLLDPNPENILAVALTGLLTWASVQVLWQLFFISIAILLAALKSVWNLARKKS